MALSAVLTATVPFAKAMARTTGMFEINSENSKTISIPDGIVGIPCKQVTVPVDVDNTAGIAGMDLEIGFDPNILDLVDVETTDLTWPFMIMHEDSGDGTIWVALAHHAGITSGSGALVHLIFEVLSNAVKYHSTEVSIRKVHLYNEEAEEIEGIVSQYGQIALQGKKMDFPAGWSIFSLPVVPEDASISALFSDDVVVYKYEKTQGYVHVLVNEQLVAGKGYWILFKEGRSYNLTGQPIESYKKTINEDGWELVGGCAWSAQAMVDPDKIIVIYQYVQGSGYQRVVSERLDPGKGYWILFKDIENGIEFRVGAIGNYCGGPI